MFFLAATLVGWIGDFEPTDLYVHGAWPQLVRIESQGHSSELCCCGLAGRRNRLLAAWRIAARHANVGSTTLSAYVVAEHRLVMIRLNSGCVSFVCENARGLDNHWICKPFNLARGLDTVISNNLACLLRLSESGPKVRIVSRSGND